MWLVVAMASLLAQAPVQVPTQENEDALVREGVEKRRHGDDAAALALFQRAWAVAHGPRALAQVGLAEMALGQWPEAEAHLAAALGAPDEWIARNRPTLATSLGKVREHLGDLDVIGSPAGAEIVCDGRMRGKLPLAAPLRLPVGEVRFEVRAPGHVAVIRLARVPPGGLARERVDLAPAAAPLPLPSPSPGATAAGVVGAAAPGGWAPSPRALRVAGLGAAGLGAAALVTSLVFGVRARDADTASRANGHCTANDCDAAGLALRDEAFARARVATVAFVAGAVLAGGGVALVLVGRRREQRIGARLSAAAMAGGGAAGIAIGGRF